MIEITSAEANPSSLSSLQLFEDGSRQVIQSVAGPGTPVSLCIQIDVSESMKSKGLHIRDAAMMLIRNLPPGSEVMLTTFAEKSFLVQRFTPASEFDPRMFEHLLTYHRTALYDSVVITEPYFVHFARFPRRAYVLITDAGENASGHNEGDAERTMLMPGSPFVYLIRPVDPYAATPQERAWGPMDLFSSSHAHIIPALSVNDIPESALEVSKYIDSQYALSYTSPGTMRDKRLHKIEIKLAAPDPHIKIDALPGYYIPEQ